MTKEDNKIPSDIVKQYIKLLDEKKAQTTYKIEYVSAYVEKWLYVMANSDKVKNINFVDCMCNAGVYKDGEKGTAIRVLELFNKFALEHTNKNFNIILNDYNEKRLEVMKKVMFDVVGIKAKNINVVFENKDVNKFLENTLFFSTYFNCYPYRSANLIFVDPYNFSTVKISTLNKFLSQNYCELLFNVFTSDYVRNHQNDEKMKKFCAEEGITSQTQEDLIKFIKNKLKVGNIKYSFAYEFKITTNIELYQIMFFTPNIAGLEKLKEALWDTFKGKSYHRNEKATQGEQIGIFSVDEVKDLSADGYSAEAKEMILEEFSGKTINFSEIEIFVIENTMLSSNHLIRYVLKPLISEGKIIKVGNVKRANNYKDDKYTIGTK